MFHQTIVLFAEPGLIQIKRFLKDWVPAQRPPIMIWIKAPLANAHIMK